MGLDGFTLLTRSEVRRRLIVSLEGLEKCGKTHLALTAPDPIAFMNLDNGFEGVVEAFVNDGKRIHLTDYRGKASMLKLLGMGTEDTKAYYAPIWTRFRADYLRAMESPDIRTVVWDTGSEVWELARLAAFGKVDKVMPTSYGPVNSEFKALVDVAYSCDKNLIILHKVKKQYVLKDSKEVWNGKYERAGFSSIGFLVQMVGRCFRDGDNQFCMEVADCRHNAACNGRVFEGEECAFPWIASEMITGSTPMDWGL